MLQMKDSRFCFDGYTVIIPTVCVGNVAQLCCDLIISARKLQRIGIINHPALIPLYGLSAFQHQPLEKSVACEVYADSKDKLLVLQMRTPLISKHIISFHKKIVEIVQNVQRVIILTGSFDFQTGIIRTSPYEYKANATFNKMYEDQLKTVTWNCFTGDSIYGGGNSLQLYKELENNNIPSLLLLRYLFEGDNCIHASFILKELKNLCNNFLGLEENDSGEEFNIPISWKLLFGNDILEMLF